MPQLRHLIYETPSMLSRWRTPLYTSGAACSAHRRISMPQSSKFGPYRTLRKLLPKHMRKVPSGLEDQIPFGRIRTDHMAVCDFLPQKGGWQPLEIVPYSPFETWPDAVVFHYGQQIFEGMKAYCNDVAAPQKTLHLFRPDQNAQRFFQSARRLEWSLCHPIFFYKVFRSC
jgi:hypothetical protein